MIWLIATNPILSLLERSSEKLIHTLLTKFSPRNSLDRPFPFVRTNHDQKYHSSDTNVFGLVVFRKRKQYSQSTWLQINIFFLFLSFKTEKKMVADAWRPDFSRILCCKFVCGFHLLERLLKVHAN